MDKYINCDLAIAYLENHKRVAKKQNIILSANEDSIIKFLKEKCPAENVVELPPIKIGDTAYFIIHREICKAEVYFIRWEHHKQYGIRSEIFASVGRFFATCASFDDFGKTVFLTEEEAEAALEKMDGWNEDG